MLILIFLREDLYMRWVDMKGVREILKIFGIGVKLYLYCESNVIFRLVLILSVCYKEVFVLIVVIFNDVV